MYKHPVSAFVRLFPAIAWVGVCVVTVWALSTLLRFVTPDRWSDPKQAALQVLFVLGFVALLIYGMRMAYKEYMEVLPALRADTPIRLGPLLPRRPAPPLTTSRYPLSDSLKIQLRRVIEALEVAEVLQPGEAVFEEVVDFSETVDDFSEIGLYEVTMVLAALEDQRGRPFANLAFFPDQVETDDSDALVMVRELARLCGQSQQLGAVRVQAIGGGEIVPAHRGEFPPPNAVAEFDLGPQRCRVPFVMYSKNLPGGLLEGLTKVFARADDPRQFVWEYFDSFMCVSYLTPAATETLNSSLPGDPVRFVAIE